MTSYVCPHCEADYRNPDTYIAHRFTEIARWFENNGELDNAKAYRAKNPTDYRIVNGLIERKVP